jgi:hypothetical protein
MRAALPLFAGAPRFVAIRRPALIRRPAWKLRIATNAASFAGHLLSRRVLLGQAFLLSRTRFR